ncbi:Uncharacterised protein [Bordetella pertussis]|nr:Uncharacterised protein [Bordetella pertussis]
MNTRCGSGLVNGKVPPTTHIPYWDEIFERKL